MNEKYYVIGVSAPTEDVDTPWRYESYHEAYEVKEELNRKALGNFKVYSVETKVSEATHSTEDYWYYG